MPSFFLLQASRDELLSLETALLKLVISLTGGLLSSRLQMVVSRPESAAHEQDPVFGDQTSPPWQTCSVGTPSMHW